MKFVLAFCLMILCSFVSTPSAPVDNTAFGTFIVQVNRNDTGQPVLGPIRTVWYEVAYGYPDENKNTLYYFDENGLWTSYTYNILHNLGVAELEDGEIR